MTLDLRALAGALSGPAFNLGFLLTVHRRTPDGHCGCCAVRGSAVRWPCAVFALADEAARIRATRHPARQIAA